MENRNKPGKFSTEDVDFIKQNIDKDPDWIAEQLGRNVDTVRNHMAKVHLSIFQGEVDDDHSIIARLVGRKDWASIQRQFNIEELEIFKETWVRMYRQFGADVLPTEELQMISVIQLGLLKYRNLEERQESLKRIAELQVEALELRKELEEAKALGDKDLISMAVANIAQNAEMTAVQRAATKSRTDEYEKFVEKERQTFKDLKATRDARIDNVKESKTTFIDWLKQLHEREKFEEESKELALRKEALKKEKERLSDYHKYMDDSIDQPLLTPETVKDD